MYKQKLIEKLAKEMADKFNAVFQEVDDNYEDEYFIEDAITAVNMFWPLVEAVEEEHLCKQLECDSPICIAMWNLKDLED